MQWRYTGDVMCHLTMETKLWLWTCTRSKKYSFQRIPAEFLNINCNRERVGMLLTKIWKTCSTNQRRETSRLKHTHAEENVTTVDEMIGLLNHNGQKQTYRLICQISKETDLTKCSVIHIIHCIFEWKHILFTNMLAVYYCQFFLRLYFAR